MDWLSAALIRLARHDIAAMHGFDSDDRLRLWLPKFNFKVLVSAVFDQLRSYFATDRNASVHMLDHMGEIGLFLSNRDQRELMRKQADALREAAIEAMTSTRDRSDVEYAYRRAVRRIATGQAAADTTLST